MIADRKYILCERCNSLIRDKNYISHTKKIHKIILKGYDITARIRDEAKPKEAIKKNTRKKKLQNALTENQKLELQRKFSIIKAKRDEDKRINTKTYYIIWDDINFEKDRIRFSPNRINTMLHSVELKGSITDLNTIKEEYFKRLYNKEVYKLNFLRLDLLAHESPDWKRIIEKIEIGKKYFEFKTTKKNRFGPGLSIDEVVKLHITSFKKSYYLKYLASIQNEIFKVIPIIEVSKNTNEDSFLFRVLTKSNNILTIWENVNVNRATHIFVSTKGTHGTILKIIESFICTQMTSKRSLLYLKDAENIKIKKDLGYLTTIKHENLELYRRQIGMLIRK